MIPFLLRNPCSTPIKDDVLFTFWKNRKAYNIQPVKTLFSFVIYLEVEKHKAH